MANPSHKNDIARTWRWLFGAAICLTGLFGGGLCPADDRVPPDRVPFATIAFASVNRTLDDLELMLGSAGQADRLLKVRTVLDVLNHSEAIDEDRPFGLLLFVPDNPPHKPQAVVFLPGTGLDRLEETVRLMDDFSLARESDSRHFTVTAPDKTISGLHVNEWIFLTEHDPLLDEQLDDHLAAAPLDFEHHDALLTLHRNGIPQVVVDQILSKLHNDLERDLERKDTETAAEHQIRSRMSRGVAGLIERFLSDVDSTTIRLEISDVEDRARLQVRLNTRPGTPLSRSLGGLARPDSRFAAIAGETAPLTIATTWRLEGEPAGIAGGMLAQVRSQVAGEIEQPRGQLGPHPFERILTALTRTVDAGRLDALVQFVDSPEGKLVLVAAARVEEADSVAVALREIMQHLSMSDLDAGQIVDVNAFEADGVVVHRVRGMKVRRQDRRLYGDDVALLVGAGRDAVWLAVGGAHAEPALRRTIQAVPPGSSRSSPSLPILSAALHLSPWISLAGTGQTGRERKLAEAARLAFQGADQDGVHLELFADETGMQLNVEAERGYLQIFGILLASRMQRE